MDGALKTRQHHPIINLALSPMIMISSLLSDSVMQVMANSSNVKSKRKSMQKCAFDAQAFLDSAGVAKKVVEYRGSQKIYSQGDPAKGVKYIQKGGVKLSVVNEVGKEAVVAILGPGDFFWRGMPGRSACLHGDGHSHYTHVHTIH
jgi:CRP-like cAMP-binding protein